MRKWMFAAVLFLIGASVVLAQSADDLFNSSVNAGTEYRSAYSAYIQAKNQHQQYHTAATRIAAIERTNDVLTKRNRWVIAYLRFLRQTLADVTDIANYPQTVVYLDLESKINSFAQSDVLGADNFADINSVSQDWEKQYSDSDRLVLAARMQIASTRLANFQGQLAGYVDKYKQDHATPSASQQTTLNLIEDKITASVDARRQTDSQLASYKTGFITGSNYTNLLNQSQQQILDAAKLLNELFNQP